MAGPSLGLGIGLQFESDTAKTLYLTQQAAAQQEKMQRMRMEWEKEQAGEERAQKDIDSFNQKGYKWHRLLVGEAQTNSKEAIDRVLALKQSGDPYWYNKLSQIETEYNQKMLPLVSINEQYHHFDQETDMLNRGQTYSTGNAKKAIVAFNTAKDRMDFTKRATELGVSNDPWTAFHPDTGEILLTPPQRLNLDATMKQHLSGLGTIKTRVDRVQLPDGTFRNQNVDEKPLTKAEALSYYNADPNAYPSGPPRSIEDVADNLLMNPDFTFQFADQRNLDINNMDTVKEKLMQELAPYTGRKETITYKSPSKGINISVNTGDNNTDPLGTYDVGRNDFVGAIGRTPQDSINVVRLANFGFQSDYTDKTVSTSYVKPDGSRILISTFNEPKFNNVFASPYTIENGKRVPLNSKSKGAIQGLGLFYTITDSSGQFYAPFDALNVPNQIKGPAKQVSNLKKQAAEMKQLIDVVHKQLSTMVIKSKEEYTQRAEELIKAEYKKRHPNG